MGERREGRNANSISKLLGCNNNFTFALALERFSIECRKTKTNVITLANHNIRRQSNESIRTRSKNM